MKKKAIAYFYKSEDCDYYLAVDIVDENSEPLNVVEAIEKFGWDSIDYWMGAYDCKTKEELVDKLPYAKFITDEKIIE